MSVSKVPTPRLPRPGAQYSASQQTLLVDTIERHFDVLRAQGHLLVDAVDGRYASILITAATATIDATYIDRLVETTAAATVITIPTDAQNDLGSGCVIRGVHHGAGTVSFTGVTLVYPVSLSSAAPYGALWVLIKSFTAADKWALSYIA